MEPVALGGRLVLLLGGRGDHDDQPTDADAYPTARLCRGPRPALAHRPDGPLVDLTEEGVGFGVPVLRSGRRCLFASSARVTVLPLVGDRGAGAPLPPRERHNGSSPYGFSCDPLLVRYLYHLDVAEHLHLGGMPDRTLPIVDRVREAFSALHRAVPSTRPVLDRASASLHRTLRTSTSFDREPFPAVVGVVYVVRPMDGSLDVHVDARAAVREGVEEVTVMNELGATAFTRYQDTSGRRLDGAAIGSWTEVDTPTACFAAPEHGVSFTVRRLDSPGERDDPHDGSRARLFRGREHAPGRLAWAGLAFALPPTAPTISYQIRLDVDGGRGEDPA